MALLVSASLSLSLSLSLSVSPHQLQQLLSEIRCQHPDIVQLSCYEIGPITTHLLLFKNRRIIHLLIEYFVILGLWNMSSIHAYHVQRRREKIPERYADWPVSIEKLSSRAFQRYMTTLYRHVIYSWKALELNF